MNPIDILCPKCQQLLGAPYAGFKSDGNTHYHGERCAPSKTSPFTEAFGANIQEYIGVLKNTLDSGSLKGISDSSFEERVHRAAAAIASDGAIYRLGIESVASHAVILVEAVDVALTAHAGKQVGIAISPTPKIEP